MFLNIRDPKDFSEAVSGWASRLRSAARRLGPMVYLSAFTPGLIGGGEQPRPIGGTIGGYGPGWTATGPRPPQCPAPGPGDGAHYSVPDCGPPPCAADIFPFDTVGATGFPLAGGGTAQFSPALRGVRTFQPHEFFFMGLDTAAALAPVPVRLNGLMVGSTEQLIAQNLNSLCLTQAGTQRALPVRWGVMDSTPNGTPLFTFANDLGVGVTIRVIGYMQGAPNVPMPA